MKIQSSFITYKNSKSVSLSRVYCVKSVPPKLGVRTCIGCTCLWRDRLHWPSERELPQFRQFRRLQKLCLSLKISCLLHPPPLPPVTPHTSWEHFRQRAMSGSDRRAGGEGLIGFLFVIKCFLMKLSASIKIKYLDQTIPKFKKKNLTRIYFFSHIEKIYEILHSAVIITKLLLKV